MRNLVIRSLCILVAVALVAPNSGYAQSNAGEVQAAKHAAKAKTAFKAGQWDAAIDHLKAAHKLHAAPKYLFNIGLVADKAGKHRLALDAFRAYLGQDKDGTDVVTARAMIKKLTALLATARATGLANTIAAHVKKAKTHSAEGKHDAAAFEYGEAYRFSNSAEHLFESAESYKRAAAKDRAIKTYKAYLAADGTGKFAITARARIDALENGNAVALTTPVVTKKAKKKSTKWLWVAAGVAVIAAGIAADTVPSNGSNGKFDATDILPVGLYGVGIAGLVVGVF